MSICKFSFLTFVVFLVLKLCGVTESWSWGYVLLPFAVFFGGCGREAELEKSLGRDLSNL